MLDNCRNIQWMEGFPNKDIPNIAFSPILRKFANKVFDRKYCVCCTSIRRKLYTLRGSCDDSLIGKNIYIFFSSFSNRFENLTFYFKKMNML